MKKVIALMLVGLLIAMGCSLSPTVPANEPGSSTPIYPDNPPQDVNWISPAKVVVGNFYPGARAEWTLLIHNGNDHQATFAVTYRHPDNVDAEYAKPTPEVKDWVIIVDTTPVLAPKETKEILIALEMPEGAGSPAPLWEFWISVRDNTQTGMVAIELCCRWLVSMRE